jgi:hypothetical protein
VDSPEGGADCRRGQQASPRKLIDKALATLPTGRYDIHELLTIRRGAAGVGRLVLPVMLGTTTSVLWGHGRHQRAAVRCAGWIEADLECAYGAA